MRSNKILYSNALASAVIILIMVNNAGAAPFAYIANILSGNVSVIDTSTNNITATINVGSIPAGIAVSPDGTNVYVTNNGYNTVTVINTTTNNVTAKVKVGEYHGGVAVNPQGTKVYVADTADPRFDNGTVTIVGTVSVIDTATNNVIATILVGNGPEGVAVTPDGTKVYVTNSDSDNISVIDTETNNVTATIPVGSHPFGVAITPDGTKVYVTNLGSDNISVINTETNNVTATIPVGSHPLGVAATPDGTKIYIARGNDTVSVINTATNTVADTVPVGLFPSGVAVTPDGTKVYVTNYGSDSVSVIDAPTNKVIFNVTVGSEPYAIAIGEFMGSAPIKPIYPVTNFSSNVTSGYAPLSVQFIDHSQNASVWSWDFNNDGVAESSIENPTYTYTNPGKCTVNLTVSNENRTDSRTATITVLKAKSFNNNDNNISIEENGNGGTETGHAIIVHSEVSSSTDKANENVTTTPIRPQDGNPAHKQSNENTAAKIEQTPEQKKNISGFEVMFGITAMLAVFIYRRS